MLWEAKVPCRSFTQWGLWRGTSRELLSVSHFPEQRARQLSKAGLWRVRGSSQQRGGLRVLWAWLHHISIFCNLVKIMEITGTNGLSLTFPGKCQCGFGADVLSEAEEVRILLHLPPTP